MQIVVNPANNHVYYLLGGADGTSGITPSDGELYARKLGGHLVTINDAGEDAWIRATFTQPYYYLWTGLNDVDQEGQFVWYSGEPVTYTNWLAGEPNNANGVEDWVQIYNFGAGNYQWNDNGNVATISGFPAYAVVEVDPAISAGDEFTRQNTLWQGNLNTAEGKFHGDYRFTPGVGTGAAATAEAAWTFEDLLPGTYEIWVTWPEHENRASNAPYTVTRSVQNGNTYTTATAASATIPSLSVNQKFAPAGDPTNGNLGGVKWQKLGTAFTVGKSAPNSSFGTLSLALSNSADGIVAADAVRLVRVDANALSGGQTLLDGLVTVDLRGNPLDNDAQNLFAPLLESLIENNSTTTIDEFGYQENAGPALSPLSPVAINSGASYQIDFDTTDFGNNGTTPTLFSGVADTTNLRELVLQSNGMALAAGYTTVGGTKYATITRYIADGSVDAAFGTNGVLKTDLVAEGDSGTVQIELQSWDNKLIVSGGTFNGVMSVARYMPNGSIDVGFGNSGYVQIASFKSANALTVGQADHSIVVAGTGFAAGHTFQANDIGVARISESGQSVLEFRKIIRDGFDGFAPYSPWTSGNGLQDLVDSATQVYVQSDGKIVVAGRWYQQILEDDIGLGRPSSTYRNGAFIWRFNSDGSFDADFSGPETVHFRNVWGGVDPYPPSSSAHPWGWETFNKKDVGLIVDVFGPGPVNPPNPDYTFINDESLTGRNTIQRIAEIHAQGANLLVLGTYLDEPRITRFTLAGVRDMSFGTSGTGQIALDFTASRVVVDTVDNSFYLAGSLNGVPIVRHYTANGTLDTLFSTGGTLYGPSGAVLDSLTLGSDRLLVAYSAVNGGNTASSISAYTKSGALLSNQSLIYTAASDQPATNANAGSLSFNDNVVTLPRQVLDGRGDLTVEFWFKTPRRIYSGGTVNQMFVKAGNQLTDLNWANSQFELFMPNQTNPALMGRVISLLSKGGPATFTNLPYPVDDDQWHHLAVIRNEVADQVTLYIDGASVGTLAAAAPIGPLSVTAVALGNSPQTFSPVTLGVDGAVGAYQNSPSYQFMGQLDEVRFWNTTRSAGQIEANMHRRLTGSGLQDTALVAYYTFDDGAATDQKTSGNPYHGTLGDSQGSGNEVRPAPALTSAAPLVTTGPAVRVDVIGDQLTATPISGFSGTARITVTAHDGPNGPNDFHGRTSEQSFDLHVSGSPTGSAETLVNMGDTAGDQVFPEMAMAANGDYVVVWRSDPTPSGVHSYYAQLYFANGQTKPNGRILIDTTINGVLSAASVAMEPNGEFVVAYGGGNQAVNNHADTIYAKRYTRDGVPVPWPDASTRLLIKGPDFAMQVNTYPEVAVDDDGDMIIAWQTSGAVGDIGFGIFARRIDKDGNFAVGPDLTTNAFHVNTTTADDQQDAAVAMDAVGDFVIAWHTYEPSIGPPPLTRREAYARWYSNTGQPRSASDSNLTNTVSGYHKEFTEVAMDALGNTLVVWRVEDVRSAPRVYLVQGRRYDVTGSPLSSELTLSPVVVSNLSNSISIGDQQEVSVSRNGEFVVTWSMSQNELDDVYAQRFDPTGTPRESEFLVNQYALGNQRFPVVALHSDGDFVVAWRSEGQDGSGFGVYSRQFDIAPAGGIYGTKYNDLSNFGTRDPAEPGVEGVRIFLDTNGDGQWQSAEPSKLTDANGDYSFTNLAFGSYTVREVVPVASTQKSPPVAHSVSLSVTTPIDNTGNDFGNFRVVNAGVDRQGVEGTAVVFGAAGGPTDPLHIVVRDPNTANGSDLSYHWEVTTSNGDMIPSSSEVTVNGQASFSPAFTFTPHDNGRYTATLVVKDLNDGNREYRDSVDVFVINVAPQNVAINGVPALPVEGTPINLTAGKTDPGTLDTFTYLWTVTRSGQPYATGTPMSAATLGFTPNDEGTYLVGLTVTDDDGGATPATPVTLVVANAVPTAAFNLPAGPFLEGTPISFSGMFSDLGPLDTVAAYEWSVTKDAQPYNANVALDQSMLTFTPIDQGAYVVSLRVRDNDGDWSPLFSRPALVVGNVKPTAVIQNAPGTVVEGTPLSLTSLVTDPGVNDTFQNYQWVVTRNSLPYAPGVPTNQPAFSFAPRDNGSYLVTLTVQDNAGAPSDAVSAPINVTNVVPSGVTILGVPAGPVNEGATIPLSSTKTDPGVDDTFTYAWTVTRGGQSWTPATATNQSAFNFTPDDDGTYEITLSVHDDDELTVDSDARTIVVAGVAPTAVASLSLGNKTEGQGFTFALVSPSDPSLADTLDGFDYLYDLDGDGIFETTAMTAAPQPVLFADNGRFLLRGRITDKDGLFTEYPLEVNVGNVAPSNINPNLANVASVRQEIPVEFSGTFADAGDDTWLGTVDFGDGTQAPVLIDQATKSFSLWHTYDEHVATSYNVMVTVRDDDGGMQSAMFNVAVVGPTVSIEAVTPDPRMTAVNEIAIAFDEPVTGFNLADLTLRRNGGSNLLPASATLTSTDQIHWTLGNLTGLTGTTGAYVLTLTAAGSGIADLFGHPLGAGATESFVVDVTVPTADIIDVMPDPRTTAVGSIAIDFTEAVTGFDLADLVLKRDNGANLLPAMATLTPTGQMSWTLGNLSGLTGTPGVYTLTLTAAGSGIADLVGNMLGASATESWTFTNPAIPGDVNNLHFPTSLHESVIGHGGLI